MEGRFLLLLIFMLVLIFVFLFMLVLVLIKSLHFTLKSFLYENGVGLIERWA